MVPANTKAAPASRKASGAIPVGVPGGVPGGVVGGVPGGVVGGKVGGQLGGVLGQATHGVAQKRLPVEPLKAVMARAIYAPNPDTDKLARTETGLMRRGRGVNKTGFCIDKSGRTTDVRTNKKYPGDPKIDALCRRTVAKWRFRPFLVGGKPAKVCSVARFEIIFE